MKQLVTWAPRLNIANAVVIFIQGACFCRNMMDGRTVSAALCAVGAIAITVSSTVNVRRREQLLHTQDDSDRLCAPGLSGEP